MFLKDLVDQLHAAVRDGIGAVGRVGKLGVARVDAGARLGRRTNVRFRAPRRRASKPGPHTTAPVEHAVFRRIL